MILILHDETDQHGGQLETDSLVFAALLHSHGYQTDLHIDDLADRRRGRWVLTVAKGDDDTWNDVADLKEDFGSGKAVVEPQRFYDFLTSTRTALYEIMNATPSPGGKIPRAGRRRTRRAA